MENNNDRIFLNLLVDIRYDNLSKSYKKIYIFDKNVCYDKMLLHVVDLRLMFQLATLSENHEI